MLGTMDENNSQTLMDNVLSKRKKLNMICKQKTVRQNVIRYMSVQLQALKIKSGFKSTS